MSTISGLPAHILLNHFVVVLVPLTAILLILCTVWAAARDRLVWLVLALSIITLIVTPLTIKSGEWLADNVDESPDLDAHMSIGGSIGYVAAALAVAAALLAGLHVRLSRGHRVQPVAQWVVAVVVIGAAATAMLQIHRVGESGARAAWGSFQSSSGG